MLFWDFSNFRNPITKIKFSSHFTWDSQNLRYLLMNEAMEGIKMKLFAFYSLTMYNWTQFLFWLNRVACVFLLLICRINSQYVKSLVANTNHIIAILVYPSKYWIFFLFIYSAIVDMDTTNTLYMYVVYIETTKNQIVYIFFFTNETKGRLMGQSKRTFRLVSSSNHVLFWVFEKLCHVL